MCLNAEPPFRVREAIGDRSVDIVGGLCLALIHRLEQEVGEVQAFERGGLDLALRVDQLELIAALNDDRGGGLGADADPVDADGDRLRAIRLDGDLEALRMKRVDGGDIELQERFAARAHHEWPGALGTNVVTPSGLDAPGMPFWSTPRDLVVIFRAAMANPVFAQITAMPSTVFPAETGDRVLVNQDELLHRYPGTIGGKTGFTDIARKTFVAAAQRDGRRSPHRACD